MGNSESAGISQRDVGDLPSDSGFTQKELGQLMKRYTAYDSSERGQVGITLSDCLSMTEFSGNKFMESIVGAHLEEFTHRIHPKSFVNMCSLLSSKTPAAAKKHYLFELMDVRGTGVLTHDEMFHIYKLMFGGAISDDHILHLTFLALRHPSLYHPGEITENEFMKMVPDNEVLSKLTIDFHLGNPAEK